MTEALGSAFCHLCGLEQKPSGKYDIDKNRFMFLFKGKSIMCKVHLKKQCLFVFTFNSRKYEVIKLICVKIMHNFQFYLLFLQILG